MEEPLLNNNSNTEKKNTLSAGCKARPLPPPARPPVSMAPGAGKTVSGSMRREVPQQSSHLHQKENAAVVVVVGGGAAAGSHGSTASAAAVAGSHGPTASALNAAAAAPGPVLPAGASSRKRDSKLRTISPGSSVSSSIGAPASAATTPRESASKAKNASLRASNAATADSKPASSRPVRTAASQAQQSHAAAERELSRKRAMPDSASPAAAKSKLRARPPVRRAVVVPQDIDDLLSEEELEFQDFVTKTFEPKDVLEDQPSWLADGAKPSGGTAIIHSQVESSEIPFWNLQHRKLIGIQIEEHSRTLDLRAISGKPSSTTRPDSDTSAKYSQWNESYPFRLFFNGSELPLDIMNHSITLAVASSSTEKVFQDGGLHRAARLRARSAASRKKPDVWGTEPRDNISKRFQTHPSRKGWLKCVQCEHDVWPPNRSKHICASLS